MIISLRDFKAKKEAKEAFFKEKIEEFNRKLEHFPEIEFQSDILTDKENCNVLIHKADGTLKKVPCISLAVDTWGVWFCILMNGKRATFEHQAA